MPRNKVQVLLPTYNASRWFEDALRSVADQDGVEILVIDDGSKPQERDRIASVCAHYSGVRFFAEKHRGIVGTLNFGLSLATAPYIARMDADDISLPGRFEAQISYLEAHQGVIVVGTQTRNIDKAGRLTNKKSAFPVHSVDIKASLFAGRCPIQHPSVLMKREKILMAGGYSPDYEYAEDYELWLRLSGYGKLANLPDVFLLHRRHHDQISTPDNVEQKKSRDRALLLYLLSSDGVVQQDLLLNWKRIIDCEVESNFIIAGKITRGENISASEVSQLACALSQNLLGEGRGFKKRLIKTLRSRKLFERRALSPLVSCYLSFALSRASSSRLSAKLSDWKNGERGGI